MFLTRSVLKLTLTTRFNLLKHTIYIVRKYYMESFMNFTIAAVLNIKILFWNPVEPTKQIVNMTSITEHMVKIYQLMLYSYTCFNVIRIA